MNGININFNIGSTLPSFQGIIGATDIKDISSNIFGKLTKLQNDGPTNIFSPVIASDKIGKIVPKRTVSVITRKKMLLNMKKFSLEKSETIS